MDVRLQNLEGIILIIKAERQFITGGTQGSSEDHIKTVIHPDLDET